MKEYWVNVYYLNGQYWLGPVWSCKILHECWISKPAYRIHVKMDGGYNKRELDRFREANRMRI